MQSKMEVEIDSACGSTHIYPSTVFGLHADVAHVGHGQVIKFTDLWCEYLVFKINGYWGGTINRP